MTQLALLRGAEAPAIRTLVDIFTETVESAGDEPAIDTGAEVLTYTELAEAADELALTLHTLGVRRGDKVGVRIKSGTTSLYVAILGILHAGCAYVPVDADDPDDRARLVFGEAKVVALVGNDLAISLAQGDRAAENPVIGPELPEPTDDAWVIFTSGSTGTPKGVAVSHRSAAAFVDAERLMFLTDEPLGPGDRVMAGLSVGFDASCEEMWLAWAYGACLVPAPRSLVRSGVDVGPWLQANRITVVSTVPTLVSMWPTESLESVRLLIMGGEACPPEIGARLARDDRELWNTYGPTEATVVSCGALIGAEGPVRIGLPLAGWDLAVVDSNGQHVAEGEVGELIIGGVGLARYLDPAKDAEKYAAMPELGWDRAYRSGDHVTFDPEGLLFAGRADDQIKLGGRRIELGEIDSTLLSLPGVVSAGTAVRRSAAGNQLLVGYIVTDETYSHSIAKSALKDRMPAAMVPRLAVVEEIPTRSSGKIDRDALPWPLPDSGPSTVELSDDAAWIADLWFEVIGAKVRSVDDDFFDLGGGSLTAAQLVSRLRARYPEVTVADLYENPTVARLSAALPQMDTSAGASHRAVRPMPLKSQIPQTIAWFALRTISGLRWLTWLALGAAGVAAVTSLEPLPSVSWPLLLLAWALLIFPGGRILLAAAGARLLLAGVQPGEHPRGGRVHLRLWLAERLVEELGATNLSAAAWMPTYARLLGAQVGRDVDLHSIPPVTGMLTLGDGCSVEPEVDLCGHWLDGDLLHLGTIEIGSDARVGTRSTVMPGTRIGNAAEVAPGALVLRSVPGGEYWTGSPAGPVGPARGPWSSERPPRRRGWTAAYVTASMAIALLPVIGAAAALSLVALAAPAGAAVSDLVVTALVWLVPAAFVGITLVAVLALLVVRGCSRGLQPGHYPIHSSSAWRAWVVLRTLDECRTWLFPLYASTWTPIWLRLLGARVGKDVEASTVLLIPALTTINDEAFLADDTLIGSYELGGGYLRISRVKIGKRAFVGNSGMTAPGRKVPKESLVAVLSAAPRRSDVKAGSSWLGSPPVLLRRPTGTTDVTRTFRPPRKLRIARASVELCRAVPVLLALALVIATIAGLGEIWSRYGLLVAALLSGPVMAATAVTAAALATVAKWVLVGRHKSGNHPLWSSFIWRNELADTFIESMAAPFFARSSTGTVLLNVWLRSMGAAIGRGVWCESYWLPEADLVELRDGVAVNRGCVLQTHLFHDRVMSLDTVTLRRGATLGPNSVVLPASRIGRHATVGPASLVMRGEVVPTKTWWVGNPISPWQDDAGSSDG